MNDLHMLLAMQEMLYYTVVAVCIITLANAGGWFGSFSFSGGDTNQ